jgi:Flp pilus assembly protein TadD
LWLAPNIIANEESGARLGIVRVDGSDRNRVGIPYSAMFSPLLVALLCTSQSPVAYAASTPDDIIEPVCADLTIGRADDAISRLSSSLAANPGDAEAHNLLCRVYYQEQRWDNAIHECEIAARLMPLNSGYHLWLGRAYGEKADSIHSIKAYGLAKKVRDEFERAVQLDNASVDALSDLGEFYTAAPEIVGGGKKKAEGVVQALEQYGPPQSHQLKGRLAEKDKKYILAETEFKAAVEASNQSPDAWMALASFYSRRHQSDLMLQAVRAGVDADAKAAKPHGPALVDGAAILSHDNLEPQLAIQLLELYLASPNKSADSPAFQVHAQLSRLLAQQGDQQGAQHQIEEATALAREYHPADPRTLSQ